MSKNWKQTLKALLFIVLSIGLVYCIYKDNEIGALLILLVLSHMNHSDDINQLQVKNRNLEVNLTNLRKQFIHLKFKKDDR